MKKIHMLKEHASVSSPLLSSHLYLLPKSLSITTRSATLQTHCQPFTTFFSLLHLYHCWWPCHFFTDKVETFKLSTCSSLSFFFSSYGDWYRQVFLLNHPPTCPPDPPITCFYLIKKKKVSLLIFLSKTFQRVVQSTMHILLQNNLFNNNLASKADTS